MEQYSGLLLWVEWSASLFSLQHFKLDAGLFLFQMQQSMLIAVCPIYKTNSNWSKMVLKGM